MSQRRLTLTIFAGEYTCDGCPQLSRAVGDDLFVRPHCALFRVELAYSVGASAMSTAQRCSGCLAAESAARPWQGSEDDDDPTPHHLRVKP